MKWNEVNMHFLKHPLFPRDGSIEVPDRPGIGMELDEEKIERERDVDV